MKLDNIFFNIVQPFLKNQIRILCIIDFSSRKTALSFCFLSRRFLRLPGVGQGAASVEWRERSKVAARNSV